MRPHLRIAALCRALALPAFADQADPVRPATGPGAKVTVAGDTLTYIGGIEADGLARPSASKDRPRKVSLGARSGL